MKFLILLMLVSCAVTTQFDDTFGNQVQGDNEDSQEASNPLSMENLIARIGGTNGMTYYHQVRQEIRGEYNCTLETHVFVNSNNTLLKEITLQILTGTIFNGSEAINEISQVSLQSYRMTPITQGIFEVVNSLLEKLKDYNFYQLMFADMQFNEVYLSPKLGGTGKWEKGILKDKYIFVKPTFMVWYQILSKEMWLESQKVLKLDQIDDFYDTSNAIIFIKK